MITKMTCSARQQSLLLQDVVAWEDAEQQPATSEGDGKSEPSSSSGPDLWAAGSHVDGHNRRKHHHLGGQMMDHEVVGSPALELSWTRCCATTLRGPLLLFFCTRGWRDPECHQYSSDSIHLSYGLAGFL